MEKTGMYYLWFVICDTEQLSAATVEGATIWKNPSGAAWHHVQSAAELAMLASWCSIGSRCGSCCWGDKHGLPAAPMQLKGHVHTK